MSLQKAWKRKGRRKELRRALHPTRLDAQEVGRSLAEGRREGASRKECDANADGREGSVREVGREGESKRVAEHSSSCHLRFSSPGLFA